MTRIDFKTKRDEVGLLYRFSIGKLEREGEHFRVEGEHGVSEDRDRKKCRHGIEDYDGEYVWLMEQRN